MRKLVQREKMTCLRSHTACEWQSQDLYPDRILYPAFTSTPVCGYKVCSTGEGLWNVLAEGLKCQDRRFAFILKASGCFVARKSHVQIWLFTFKCGITIASCLLQSLIHSSISWAVGMFSGTGCLEMSQMRSLSWKTFKIYGEVDTNHCNVPSKVLCSL